MIVRDKDKQKLIPCDSSKILKVVSIENSIQGLQMNVWIGHYNTNPKEWFIVWADEKEDAWDKVDEVGDPDTHSFRELSSPGFANFHVDYNEDGPTFSPAKDKDRREHWLFLGNQGSLQNPNDYIRVLQSKKEYKQKFDMKVWLGGYLPKKERISEDCFVVWAKNQQEALIQVDKIIGNVDKDSLIEIADEGFIDFHVAYRKGQLIYSPPKEDVKSGFWINLTDVF